MALPDKGAAATRLPSDHNRAMDAPSVSEMSRSRSARCFAKAETADGTAGEAEGTESNLMALVTGSEAFSSWGSAMLLQRCGQDNVRVWVRRRDTIDWIIEYLQAGKGGGEEVGEMRSWVRR